MYDESFTPKLDRVDLGTESLKAPNHHEGRSYVLHHQNTHSPYSKELVCCDTAGFVVPQLLEPCTKQKKYYKKASVADIIKRVKIINVSELYGYTSIMLMSCTYVR